MPAVPMVMGVLNVTPDSFSDGGAWFGHDRAIDRGREMIAEGADVVDVGGESTRPGATPVSAEEEIWRVVPVVAALAPEVRISIDTRHEEVARAAVSAGATLVNDVSASLGPVAADLGVGWVAMHMQGEPRSMQTDPHYDDVVGEVTAFLSVRAEEAVHAGVDEIWLDPGFGFGKSHDHNLALLQGLDRVVALGLPVLVGLSRKATLGALLGASDASGTGRAVSEPAPPGDRLEGTIAANVWAMHQGATMIRVHDVLAGVQAAKVVAA